MFDGFRYHREVRDKRFLGRVRTVKLINRRGNSGRWYGGGRRGTAASRQSSLSTGRSIA